MPGPSRCVSRDGWSCCPPHWYSAGLCRWARSLTLNGYLLPQSPPASGAQRVSVSDRRGWMELPSGRADSQSSHSLLQMNCGARGGLGSGQTDPGILRGSKGGGWSGDTVPFSQSLSDVSKLRFSLLRKCWYKNIKLNWLYLYPYIYLAHYCSFFYFHRASPTSSLATDQPTIQTSDWWTQRASSRHLIKIRLSLCDWL